MLKIHINQLNLVVWLIVITTSLTGYAGDSSCASSALVAYQQLVSKNPVAQQVRPRQVIININTASIATLTTLKGIGAKRAQDIVSYRLTHGDFRSVDELTNVKGIGKKTLKKFRHRLSVR